jgi:hypothetical protein
VILLILLIRELNNCVSREWDDLHLREEVDVVVLEAF